MDLVANSNNIVDGKYFLAGTQSDMTNVFGDYYASGYSKATDRSFQFDAGVNIGLDKVLKGLSFPYSVFCRLLYCLYYFL